MTSQRDLFAPDHPYRHTTAGVATKHAKTALMTEALGGHGGLRLFTVAADTDALGTFTGDVKRPGGPIETAIAKARLAINAAGVQLAVASEGSFQPHPVIGIVTHHLETVVLVDAAADLVVAGHADGLAPWTRSTVISSSDLATTHLAELVHDLDPPRHRLIARPEDPVAGHIDQGITKGISDRSALCSAVARAAPWSATGRVRVETDLRAHMSELRHPLILQAAHDLARRLARRCPHCGSPGFGPAKIERGAPCRWCRTPTDSPLARIDGCPACDHRVRRPAEGSDSADPSTCFVCNP